MSKFKIGDRVKLHFCVSFWGEKVPNIVTIENVVSFGNSSQKYYVLKETGYTFFEGSDQELESSVDKPQIKVGSKWRMKDDDGSGFIAEIVSVEETILRYTSNHYPHITTTYSIDDWEGYMEPLPHQTESIITETTVRSVKAGVYGNVELIKDANTSSGFAYVSLLRNSYTKRTLSDLIETLKQIHEVM